MKASTEQDYRERIVRTLVYIQQRLDDELELEQVAGVAAFSSFHFHRIFRGLVGETLKRTTLGKTYQRIYGGWLPRSRYHLRDEPAFEQYLNSPQNTKPEDLVALIHVPLGE